MSRTGRPVEGAAPKLAPLNMRTSPQLRAQIEAAADVNGRSLTQEVERRLITSFIFDDSRGGPHIGSLANMICATIQMIEQDAGHRWMDDFDTFTMVRAAIERLLAWKNPGADLTEQVRLLKTKLRLEEIAAEARAVLQQFRAAKGLPVAVDALAELDASRDHAVYETRASWTDEDFDEEIRLEFRADQAAQQAAVARRAHDEWIGKAFAHVESIEHRGRNIANAIFDDLGPRG